MTVLCLFCKEKGKSGKSRVLESRQADFRGTLVDARIRTKTTRRRRECLECKYRWTTIETVQNGSYCAKWQFRTWGKRQKESKESHDKNSGTQPPADNT
jgi:hypothetical protein